MILSKKTVTVLVLCTLQLARASESEGNMLWDMFGPNEDTPLGDALKKVAEVINDATVSQDRSSHESTTSSHSTNSKVALDVQSSEQHDDRVSALSAESDKQSLVKDLSEDSTRKDRVDIFVGDLNFDSGSWEEIMFTRAEQSDDSSASLENSEAVVDHTDDSMNAGTQSKIDAMVQLLLNGGNLADSEYRDEPAPLQKRATAEYRNALVLQKGGWASLDKELADTKLYTLETFREKLGLNESLKVLRPEDRTYKGRERIVKSQDTPQFMEGAISRSYTDHVHKWAPEDPRRYEIVQKAAGGKENAGSVNWGTLEKTLKSTPPKVDKRVLWKLQDAEIENDAIKTANVPKRRPRHQSDVSLSEFLSS